MSQSPSTPATSAQSAAAPTGAALAALEWVKDGSLLGLGTGRAASAFVEALGARVADGLKVTGVPTSEATADLANSLGIPLAKLEEVERLDITFDGADEVDPNLDLIKGYGAAMVREKVVAQSSDQLVILVGPEKMVDALGSRGRWPIEILPFAETLVRRALAGWGLDSEVRMTDRGEPRVTDNGNWVLDAKLTPPLDPRALEKRVAALPGVLGTGFFLGMADAVIIGEGENVEIKTRS